MKSGKVIIIFHSGPSETINVVDDDPEIFPEGSMLTVIWESGRISYFPWSALKKVTILPEDV